MPLSLRLPQSVEDELSEMSVRLGVTKTAVVMQSIREFLKLHARPSAQQIYSEIMAELDHREKLTKQLPTSDVNRKLERTSKVPRPHKVRVREAIAKAHLVQRSRTTVEPRKALKTEVKSA